MNPKVSYIIPMYNAEKYIGKCIDSIIAQNLGDGNYEIIVIDDGSKDNGKVVVSKYDNVRYFYKENGGQSTARNMGIELANGKYICFVDADDFLIDNTMLPVVGMAEINNLEMACFGMGRPYQIVNADTNFISYEVLTGGDYIAKNEYNNGPVWYLISNEFIKRHNLRFVEGRYGEDGMFTMSALLKAQRVQSCNRYCYCYVEQPNSTTTRRDKKHLLKMMEDYLFVNKYMRNLAEENKNIIPAAAYERLLYRSESYLFFLLARLMRYPHAGNLIDDITGRMKAESVYPIRRPDSRYYPGAKYTIVTFIVNHILLLKLSNIILSLR